MAKLSPSFDLPRAVILLSLAQYKQLVNFVELLIKTLQLIKTASITTEPVQCYMISDGISTSRGKYE